MTTTGTGTRIRNALADLAWVVIGIGILCGAFCLSGWRSVHFDHAPPLPPAVIAHAPPEPAVFSMTTTECYPVLTDDARMLLAERCEHERHTAILMGHAGVECWDGEIGEPGARLVWNRYAAAPAQ